MLVELPKHSNKLPSKCNFCKYIKSIVEFSRRRKYIDVEQDLWNSFRKNEQDILQVRIENKYTYSQAKCYALQSIFNAITG